LSSPVEARQRQGLFVYLLDTLRLRSRRETFSQVWADVMVGQWGWKPLTQQEWRRAFPGHYTPPSRIDDLHHPLCRLRSLVSSAGKLSWSTSPNNCGSPGWL